MWRIDCDNQTKNGSGGLKRFIRYLYEYQNGQRIRNVGFVKVEQQDENTVVHIHGKGLHLAEDKTLKVYIFYLKGGQCIGIWQGDIEHVNPAVNYRLFFTPEDTGRRENYSRIEGVILENGSKRRFAAVWDDTPAAVEQMRPWKEDPEPDILEMTQRKAEEEQIRTQEDEVCEEEMDGKMSEDDWTDTGEEEGKAEERGSEEGSRSSSDGVRYIKIQRQDIAGLKRCEWRLANNSFLLHRYYNYHHLLLIEEGEQCLLGVPGVYHAREAQAAEAFGFLQFRRIADDEIALEADEKNEEDDFGYWCRQVKR